MRDVWAETTLGDVTTFASGYAFPHGHQGKRSGTWPFFKVSDMNTAANARVMTVAANWIDESDRATLGARVWPAGTVIFPKVGAALLTEKRRMLGCEATFDNNVMGLCPSEHILSDFLLLFMETVRLADYVQAGAVPSINQSHVARIALALPPHGEQRRIADLLGECDSAFDRNRGEQIAVTQLRSALLADLLAPRDGWLSTPLVEVADIRLGKMLSRQSREHPDTSPYLRNANVQWGELRRGDLREMHFSESEKLEFALRAGDVLVCEGGEVGRCAVLDRELEGIYFQKALHRVRCGPRLNPWFLGHVLRYTAMTDGFADFATQSTIQHLTKEKLEQLELALPPIEVQAHVVDLLKAVDRQAAKLAAQSSRAERVRAALVEDLLSGCHEIPESYDALLAEAASA